MPVPRYQGAAVPKSGIRTQAVDTSLLINALGTFQQRAEKEYVAQRTAAARKQGAIQGAEAYAGGEQTPISAEATQAGEAFNASSRAAYMGRLEVDASDASDEFIQRWNNGDYGEDFGKWSGEYTSRMKGLTKGMDEETAAVYGARLDSIAKRTSRTVRNDFETRIKQQETAEAEDGKERITGDYLRAARELDLEAMKSAEEAYVAMLESQMDGRQLNAIQIQDELSKMKKRRFIQMDLGEFDDADNKRAFIDKYADKIPADLTPEEHSKVVAQMERELAQIEAESVVEESLTLADNARRLYPGDYNAQRAYIAQNATSPQARAATDQRLDQEERRDEYAKGKQYEEVVSAAWLEAEDGALPPEIDSLFPELKGQDRKVIHNYINKKLKGEEIETDWGLYDKLMSLPSKSLMEEHMMLYRDRLSDAEFKQVVGRRSRFIEAKATGTKDNDEGTTAQAISAAANQMEWTGADNAERRGKLNSRSRLEINAKALELERELSYEEKTNIINGLLTEGIKKETFLGFDALWRDKRVLILDIPAEDREAIQGAFEERGIKPTANQIVEAYTAGME
jgi:hypothetical protein